MNAALRHEDHVPRLERVAAALNAVADGVAAKIDTELVECVVVPADRFRHGGRQMKQAKVLAKIPALFISRLLHGCPLPVRFAHFTTRSPA